MHQPSEVSIMHQLSEERERQGGKMLHCHFFSPACETQVSRANPWFCAALRSSLRLSVIPAGSWGAAKDKRLPLAFCGSAGARDGDRIRRRPSSWGSF